MVSVTLLPYVSLTPFGSVLQLVYTESVALGKISKVVFFFRKSEHDFGDLMGHPNII